MKHRLIAAIVLACLALTLLLLRYLPTRAEFRELGDPADAFVATGAGPARVLEGVVVLPVARAAALRVPLSDGRGALTATLRLRAAAAGPRIELQAQALVLPATGNFRTVHMLAPPVAARDLRLALVAAGGPVELDHVLVVGRGGRPSPLDLLALLCVATIPAAVSLLALRLPFDWALLSGSVPLLYAMLLPAADRAALLHWGPLAALVLAGLACLPAARRSPGLAMVVLAGAAVRCYGLGWGSGYAFHADEQVLMRLWERAGLPTVLGWRLGGAANVAWGALLLLRGLSALAGSAVIVLVYWLSLRSLQPRWALLAAAFVAGAPLLVQHSHVAARAAWTPLLVVLLLLAATRALSESRPASLWWTAPPGIGLVLVSPAAVGWLAAPLVAGLVRRRQWTLPALAQLAALLLLGGAFWWIRLALADTAGSAQMLGASGSPVPYLYPLFNILLWGMGPLLMQLGVVGWGVALLSCWAPRRSRGSAGRELVPLVAGTLVAFAFVGSGPRYEMKSLIPFVPPLCITAAFLLQSFSQRLYPGFGRRTVRLLGGTALVLAAATSLGLLNLYRQPDARVAASRWLLAHAAAQSVLLDLPLAQAPFQLVLTADAARLGDTTPESTIAALHAARFVVASSDAADAMLAGCASAAMRDGRLGFVLRTSFSPHPHIGSWTIDDSRADALLRRDDHPQLLIFERVVQTAPAHLAALLRCDAP